jgi:hypothetical protein
MILTGWCWGVNVHVWTYYRINFMHLFDLHPRFTLQASEVFRIALDASIIYLANFLLFFKMRRGAIPGDAFNRFANFLPALLVSYVLCRFAIVLLSNRGFWGLTLLSVFAAPFARVSLLASYVGDLLTSTVQVFRLRGPEVSYTFTTSSPSLPLS